MLKATAIHLLLLLAASFVHSMEITKWIPMEWKEYNPLPSMESSQGIFHVSKVISKSGLALKTPSPLNAQAGDDFVLAIQARGHGDAVLKLKLMDHKGRWCGYSSVASHIDLGHKLQKVDCIIPVENTPRGVVEYVLPILELSQGSEIFIEKCKASIENNGIASHLPFPKEWNTFIFDQDFDDLDFPLDMIPDQIHSNHWKIMKIEDGFIRFNTEFAKPRIRNTALLYAYIYSPTDTIYTIGAGADFYMNIFVNGESILDTLKDGNKSTSDYVHYSNYKAKARLPKGQNLIVIHFQSGVSKYPRLALCGPDTLQNMEKQLIVENYLMKGDPSAKMPFLPPSQPGKNKEYSDGQSICAHYRPYIYVGNVKEISLGIGLKLYSMSNEGHILYRIGKELSLKLNTNEHTGGLILSVLHKGTEIKNLHLPKGMLPCCLTFASNGTSFFINALGMNNEKLGFASGMLPDKINLKVDMAIDFVGCYAVAGDFFSAIMKQGRRKNQMD